MTIFRLVIRSVDGRSDLFTNQLLRIKPSHYVRSVTLRHRASCVVEHEAEVIPFSDFEVIEDDVEKTTAFGLLVDVENVTCVVKKGDLKGLIYRKLSNHIHTGVY